MRITIHKKKLIHLNNKGSCGFVIPKQFIDAELLETGKEYKLTIDALE